MNAKILFAATIAVALLSSGAAMADEGTKSAQPTQALTRADVRAELLRAQAAGELAEPGASYAPDVGPSPSARQRDEVRAEARSAARRAQPSRGDTGS